MSVKEITGTDRLRQALIARNSKVNLSLFARDLGMSGDRIHDFLQGFDLSAEQKIAICDYIFGGAVIYDPTTDKLKQVRQPVRSLGVPPPVLDPKLLPKFTAGSPGKGPQFKEKPVEKPKKREGWLGGWF